MIVFSNAKINLGLCITEKRNDGYHNIESIFCPIELSDILEVAEEKKFQFHVYGNVINGNTQDNLVVKAIDLLKRELKISQNEMGLTKLNSIGVYLKKIIPTGAGLGGGSADGTFALKLLNTFFNLGFTDEKLEKLALELGSDCPFFIYNKPCLIKGRGELVSPLQLDLSSYKILLIHPGIHISTKEAYSKIKPHSCSIDWKKFNNIPVEEWKNHLYNDFENSVFPDYPEIEKIKNSLYAHGASYAQMSGSGSAVYGIYEKSENLESIKKTFPKNYSAWETTFLESK